MPAHSTVRRPRRVVTDAPLNASTPLDALADAITPIGTHYVRNHFPVPHAEPDHWVIDVRGHVEEDVRVLLADLRADPSRVKTITVTMECAGNGRTRMTPLPPGTPWDDGAVSTARWTGIPLRDVLGKAAPRDGAREVLFRGKDAGVEHGTHMNFERSIPWSTALHEDTILAWEMNGEPLPPEHGFPVRVIVPGWYGVASVKWLTAIEVRSTPFEGWFQKDRYTYEGESGDGPAEPVTRMRVRALVAHPVAGDRIPSGREMTIEGRAWSGDSGIDRVEVSTDGGATFAPATLDAAEGPYAWQRFRFTWTPLAAGPATLVARAYDGNGDAQPLENRSNTYGYGNNAVLPVPVVVD